MADWPLYYVWVEGIVDGKGRPSSSAIQHTRAAALRSAQRFMQQWPDRRVWVTRKDGPRSAPVIIADSD